MTSPCALTQVGKGSYVLDPYAGTGSILIAAAAFGAQVVGADIDVRVSVRQFAPMSLLYVTLCSEDLTARVILTHVWSVGDQARQVGCERGSRRRVHKFWAVRIDAPALWPASHGHAPERPSTWFRRGEIKHGGYK